jgi:hypothetical protein
MEFNVGKLKRQAQIDRSLKTTAAMVKSPIEAKTGNSHFRALAAT